MTPREGTAVADGISLPQAQHSSSRAASSSSCKKERIFKKKNRCEYWASTCKELRHNGMRKNAVAEHQEMEHKGYRQLVELTPAAHASV